MTLVSRFVIHFIKSVVGENGREQQVLQYSLDLDAASKREATELAKQKFCNAHRVAHWSHHADRIEVSEADFPS